MLRADSPGGGRGQRGWVTMATGGSAGPACWDSSWSPCAWSHRCSLPLGAQRPPLTGGPASGEQGQSDLHASAIFSNSIQLKVLNMSRYHNWRCRVPDPITELTPRPSHRAPQLQGLALLLSSAVSVLNSSLLNKGLLNSSLPLALAPLKHSWSYD